MRRQHTTVHYSLANQLSSSTEGLLVLNNKIQPSTFEDLIGFLKQLMNQAASHLATRRATKWKSRLGKEATNERKEEEHLWGKRSEGAVNI